MSLRENRLLAAKADGASLVSGMPEIGRVVPEPGEEAIREALIYSHRLIYQIVPDRVPSRLMRYTVLDARYRYRRST